MAAAGDVEGRLAALEAQVAGLEETVRSRRIAVVDEDGVERVVLSAAQRTGSVLVRLAGRAGATTGIEVVASEPEDEAPVVGVARIEDGDVVALADLGISGDLGRTT